MDNKKSSNHTSNNTVTKKQNSSKNNTSQNQNAKSYNSKNNNSSKHQYGDYKESVNNVEPNKLILFPILFIIAIIPLIVRLTSYTTTLTKYPWFSDVDTYFDFFLYYKQLFFIIMSLIMILIISVRAYQNKKLLSFKPIFIPLAVYALLATLSSLLSEYELYLYKGNFEQFESLFVLLGYCLVVYYVYLFVQTEQDIKYIVKWLLISAFILGCLGLTQAIGHDFFANVTGWRLITPRKYWEYLDKFTFNFGDGWTYLSFYNPNYVGSYVAMVAPILFILMLYMKNKKSIIIYCITFIGLMISLISSHSTSGMIGLSIAFLLILIFQWRYLLKYIRIVIPVVVISLIAILFLNNISGNIIGNSLRKITNIQKTNYKLTDIETNDEEVVIHYSGNIMKIRFYADNLGYCFYEFEDDKGQVINSEYSATQSGTATIIDDRFPGFGLYAFIDENDITGFSVTIDGHEWKFTNQTDGSYYYITLYGKLDKISTAPSALFTGYESYATSRGYLWSRTIPLLKDNIILGSGADTFSLEFPQRDYVNLFNAGFAEELITKPHNMYLQIGVQTGVLSLLAFLLFYGMYFISSVKLYIKGRFNSYYSHIGVGILIGTFSYMVSGLANDSSITIAPVFWVLMGLGIVANSKVKLLAKEEDIVSKGKVDSSIK